MLFAHARVLHEYNGDWAADAAAAAGALVASESVKWRARSERLEAEREQLIAERTELRGRLKETRAEREKQREALEAAQASHSLQVSAAPARVPRSQQLLRWFSRGLTS